MQSSPGTLQHLSRRKRIALKLSLILFGLLIGFLLAEVGLRVAGYTYPTFYAPDERLGYVLQPGLRGWYRKEGEAYIEINSAGLRDREHARQKPPNTFRIAVLGDSYAEALQVPLESAFWHVMGERLRACPGFKGQQIEVINFGVSGYGTAQELITLRERVWDYAPDLVLLAFTTNNDVTDNSRALKKTDEIPYFVLRNGALVEDDSFRDARAFRLRRSALTRLGAWIRDHSRAVQAVHQTQHALKNYLARRRAERAAQAQRTTQPSPSPANAPAPDASPARTPTAAELAARVDELGADNLVYRDPLDATWEEAWRVTEALLVQMNEETKSHGARLVVVTLSNGIQVHPDPNARTAFMRRVGATDLFYPDERINAFCRAHAIESHALARDLQTYAERQRVFLHGFGADLGNGHWNAEGHRVAGELLAQKLCDNSRR